jgi:mxaJ protein
MSSRFLERLLAVILLAAAFALLFGSPAAQAAPPALRVCADPDNLPFSHHDGSGFENRIARLLADELHRELQSVWWPQRRGFVRKTLAAGTCDLIIGAPSDFDRVLTTRPYYRSSFVLVTRQGDAQPLRSFDDTRLAALRIGIPLVSDDLAATPVGHALARRGATAHVVGFTVDGEGPAAERMLQALARGDLDAAMLWGPAAGYFAELAAVPMRVQTLAPLPGLPLPFAFDISMGVRRDEAGRALRDEIEAALDRRGADIQAILSDYAVPLMAAAPAGAAP